jgi:hypothetical protein
MSIADLLPTLMPLSREEQMQVLMFLARELKVELDDPRCLFGLSVKELRALSACKLTVSEQEHLSDLLHRNSEGLLSTAEQRELAELVEQSDQLSLLKTRAQYTLHRLAAA